jgi:hypothetical protein
MSVSDLQEVTTLPYATFMIIHDDHDVKENDMTNLTSQPSEIPLYQYKFSKPG